MSVTLYGLKNCDTCRKAIKWLEEYHIEYRFHDVRADGLTAERITAWLDVLDWETLLNRRSTTWRELDDASKEDLDANKAAALLLAHPTLAKRPVIEHSSGVAVGFSPSLYEQVLSGS